MLIHTAARSDVGLARQENQDCIVLHGWTAQSPHLAEDTTVRLAPGGAWSAAVLDGMGGYTGGALAAVVAGSRLGRELREMTGDASSELCLEAYRAADAAITEVAMSAPDLSRMGATAAAVVIDDASYVVTNAGDARIYRWWRGQYLAQLSVDDRPSPTNHVVSQSLGVSRAGLADVHHYRLPIDDSTTLILASDGLSDAVDDTTIKSVFAGEPDGDVSLIADRLLRAVLDAGAPDNVSFVVLRFEPTPAGLEPAAAPDPGA